MTAVMRAEIRECEEGQAETCVCVGERKKRKKKRSRTLKLMNEVTTEVNERTAVLFTNDFPSLLPPSLEDGN